MFAFLNIVICVAFLARDSKYATARYMPSLVRLSVCLSVTVEVRIMQLSPQSSPMTRFVVVNFIV